MKRIITLLFTSLFLSANAQTTFRCLESEIFAKGCPTCDNSRTGKMITGIELNQSGVKTEFINPVIVKYDSLNNVTITDYRFVSKTFKLSQTSYDSIKPLLKALGYCTSPDGRPFIDTLQYVNDSLGISLYGDSVAMSKVKIMTDDDQKLDTAKYENDTLYLSLDNDNEAVKKIPIATGDDQKFDTINYASDTLYLSIQNDGEAVHKLKIESGDDQKFDTIQYANDTLYLSLEGDNEAVHKLNIESGGGGSDNQKIDTFEIASNLLKISLEGDGEMYKSVSLAPYLDNTDGQTLSFNTGTGDLTISTGNTVDLDGRYLITEVDGSVTNEIQTIDTFRISGGNLELSLSSDGQARKQIAVTSIAPVQSIIAGTGISTSGTNDITITNTGDLSNTNEGLLGVAAGASNSSVLYTNTVGSNSTSIIAAGINTISEVVSSNGGSITITATEVDGSTTNEIQSLSYGTKSGSNIPLNILSSTGVTLTEGTGITLTRNSSSQVTVTNAGDLSATNELQNLTFGVKSGSNIPLYISSGTGITITEGANTTITRNSATQITISSTGSGGLSDGDYTDIDVSGSGTVLTVDTNAITTIKILDNAVTTSKIIDDAITNAKLANMATSTFKGRTTAGTGDPEDLTVAQAKTLLNLTGTNTGDQTITLTGDVTGSGTGSFATTLATVNSNVGSFGTASQVATFTVNGKGLITAASNTSIQITESQVTNLTTDLLNKNTAIVIKDEGTPIVSSVVNVDFVGAGVTASGSAGNITITVPGGLGLTDGDKGDVDVSSSGTVWEIDTNSIQTVDILNDAVTYSKIQNVSANSFLVNSTGSNGDVTELTLSASQLAGRGSTGNIAPISVGGILSFSGTTLNATEVDGSTSNELQDLTFGTKSGGDIPFNISSGSGVTLTEGAGITLTRNSGTQVTITATAGGGYTDENAQDAVGAMVNSSLQYIDATPILSINNGDFGDIDVSSNGTAWTIDSSSVTTIKVNDNAITNAKLADVATATFKGRSTAGTGDPEDLTVAQAKTLLNLSGTNTGDQTITLTGDVTGSGTGSFATTLATVNSNTGNFGNASNVATFTVNGKGLITAASNTAIQITESQVTNLVTDLLNKNTAIVIKDEGTPVVSSVINVDFVGAGVTASGSSGNITISVPGGTGLSDGDKGDVDVTSSGSVWTVDTSAITTIKINDNAVTTAKVNDDAITYGKLQNVAANSFLGNNTGSSGNVAEITLNASQLAGRGSTGNLAAISLGGILSMSGTTLTATEADGFITNEGSLSVGAGTGTTSLIQSNTSGSATITLEAGTNITLTETGNTITIATSGIGEANTASNLGGGLANFDSKSGIDLRFNSFKAADFDLTSNLISIDYTNGQKATGSIPGFLTSTDWNTFNSKLSAEVDGSVTNELQDITFGTKTGADVPLNISGGLGVTLTEGANTTITRNSATQITISSSGGSGVGDGDKGDIDVTSSGTVWTVDSNSINTIKVIDDAVTNAKLANVATATFKGRNTAGTGDPEDLSIATAKTMLNLSGTNTGDQTITLTGDVTGSGTGSFATTLATVNSNVGSFGSATQVASFTVNGKGLITAASNTSIQIAESQVTNLVNDLLGKNTAITIKDEGTPIVSSVVNIDFVGGGVTATGSSGNITITVPSSAISDGDKTDIDVSGTGTVWEVDTNAITTIKILDNAVTTSKIINDAVTYSKIQNVSANSFLANTTGSSGDVSELSLSASQLAGRGSTGNLSAISVGGILSFSGTTLNATEVDGSTSNELQNITYGTKSGGDIPVNISSGAGVTITEGAGITLTRNSSSQITITATAGGGYTDENAQDAIGAMINSSLQYVDGTPLLSINNGDFGDIDVSSNGTSWVLDTNSVMTIDIQANAVTDAKINDVNWSKVTGRPTTLSGYGITDALTTSNTSTQDGYFSDIYLKDDNTPSHYLKITDADNLTAARTLSIVTNDADRTLTISGNSTISGTNTGDQTITLTGDVTGSGTGSFATTLATVNSNVGTFGTASNVATFTVNGKGLITAASNTAIQITESQVTNLVSDLAGKNTAITMKDEGTPIASSVINVDFVGPGVTATGSAGNITVTINGIMDGDKGDIDVTGTGTVLTVDTNAITTIKVNDNAITTAKVNNDAVTYAKIQNVSANSFLGNNTGSSGDVAEITLANSQLAGRGSSGNLTAISLTGILSMSGNNLTASEVDGFTTNEGALSVGAGSSTTSLIQSNTSGSTSVTIEAGTGMTITENVGSGIITLSTTASGINDGDKGDIDVTGGTTTWTVDTNAITTIKVNDNAITSAKINNDAVTYAKLQNVSPNAFLGNNTALSADAAEILLSPNNLAGRGSTGNLAAISVSGILSFSGTTLSATEVDGSTSNELQNLSYNTGTHAIDISSGTSAVIPLAAADGTTLGLSSFTAADFNATSGNISLDYANAQKATTGQPGFLTSTDWNTFNNKVGTTRAINTAAPLSGGGDLSADRTITTSMNTNKLIGRSTAGVGVMEEITIGSGLSLSAGTLTAPASYSDELAQDAVGLMVNQSIQYVDGTPLLAIGDRDYTDITVTGSGLTWTIDNNAITNAKLRTSAGLSVIGRSTNTTGNVADITASVDGYVLRRSATSLDFGQVATAGYTDNSVTLAKMATVATSTLLGRSTAGTGNVEALTIGQSTGIVIANGELKRDIIHARKNYEYFNDYMQVPSSTLPGDETRTLYTSGTGAVTNLQISTSEAIGVIRFETGTTSGGRSAIFSGTASNVAYNVVLGYGQVTYETRVKLTTPSQGGQLYLVLAGLMDYINAYNQLDGVYFLYDAAGNTTGSAASPNWQLVTASNNTRTFVTTSTAVNTSGSWTTLKIVVNAAASSVEYFVNGTSVGTITTNIPAGAGRETGFAESLMKTVGTTNSTMDVDYGYLRYDFTGR